ncbi:MAG TPA: hypothetical protein VN819_05255 [Thermoplasmata archaeon]|nr:hypothetical protein [Thermoplasmata archaeon]HXQ79600.1 hypothetical protein [Thermoplasmata archaeon]
MVLFLLGPSKWAHGYSPPTIPVWLHEHLPPRTTTAGGPPTPLEIRQALATRLGLDGHVAVIMESHADQAGESKAAKFSRLVQDEGVTRFAFYWPFGANRAGMDVEIGFVLERLRRKEILGEDVRILIEDDGSKRRAGGREAGTGNSVTFVSFEQGRRTRYYGDLVVYGAILPTWSDYGELLELLENIADE